MSEPRDEQDAEQPDVRPVPAPPLRLDDVDLVPEQTTDDTDAGWSAQPPRDPAAELRRYLDEKPPHHGD